MNRKVNSENKVVLSKAYKLCSLTGEEQKESIKRSVAFCKVRVICAFPFTFDV